MRTRDIKELNREIMRLDDEWKQTVIKKARLTSRIEDILCEISSLKDQISELVIEKDSKIDELKAADQDIEDYKQSIFEARNKISRLEGKEQTAKPFNKIRPKSEKQISEFAS